MFPWFQVSRVTLKSAIRLLIFQVTARALIRILFLSIFKVKADELRLVCIYGFQGHRETAVRFYNILRYNGKLLNSAGRYHIIHRHLPGDSRRTRYSRGFGIATWRDCTSSPSVLFHLLMNWMTFLKSYSLRLLCECSNELIWNLTERQARDDWVYVLRVPWRLAAVWSTLQPSRRWRSLRPTPP